MCRSAARSYLCCFASETRAAWNRADPIFDAWRLVLTNQSKRRGQLLRPQVETSKLADLNEDDNLKLSQLQNVLLLLLAFSSLSNVAASTPPNYRLSRKTCLDEAIFMICPRGSRLCHGWNNPEGRPGMSDVSPLSGISGLSFDSTLLSPLLFFCLVLFTLSV